MMNAQGAQLIFTTVNMCVCIWNLAVHVNVKITRVLLIVRGDRIFEKVGYEDSAHTLYDWTHKKTFS